MSVDLAHVTDFVTANAIDPKDQWSLLIKSSMQGNVDQVQHLICKGADVNYSCPLGWTALMLACANRHFQIVKILVGHGAHVNAQHNNGFNPVMFTMLNPGTDEMRDFLVEKGADMEYAFNWLKARGLFR